MRRTDLLFLFLLLVSSGIFAQEEKIRFKKSGKDLIFFKLGPPSDSIATGDRFLFLARDSARNDYSIEVENGLLRSGGDDSTLIFRHMPGMRYATFYQASLSPSAARTYLLKTVPDGASSTPRTVVSIVVRDRMKGLVLIENWFIVRDLAEE